VFGVAWKVTEVLFERMNEPEAPHGYYDGPLKELAARHLGLIKAILFALLIALPATLFFGYLYENAFLEYKEVSHGPYGPIRDWVYVPTKYSDLIRFAYASFAVVLAVYGIFNLLYRFCRLIKLLFPHLAFYFTLLVFVPFLNVLVILLLLWGALRQMRRRGLRVGVFGIDPAPFE
jgi:hypothetical protein